MSGTANADDNKLIFSQEDFNLKIKNSREGAITEVLEAFGYQGMSLKDVKQKINDETTAKVQADKDKLEKDKNFKKLLDQERTEHSTAMTSIKGELSKLKKDIIKTKMDSKIISEATRQGAVDPTDIVALLSNNVKIDVDDESYSIKDSDGQVLSVNDAITNMLKNKPHLKRSNFKPSTVKDDTGGGGGEGGTSNAGGDENTLSHISYINEVKKLNEKYRGQHLGMEYNKELNELNIKYKNAMVSSK